MMMQIEKNVPVPPSRSSSVRTGLSSLLRKMEIGDSIVINETSRKGVHTMARYCKISVVVRREGEVYRVWRKA